MTRKDSRSSSLPWLAVIVASLGLVAGAHAQVIEAVPTVTSFTPVGGPPGTLVYISGTSFSGATAVRFNGRSTSFSVTNDTQITATVPTGATTGPISVTNSGGTGASAASFYVGSAPTISGLSPNYGAVGAVITISGTEFTGATAVAFGGQAASFTVATATQIQATVPAGAVTGYVTVTNPAGTGTSGSLFYLPPVITGYTPAGAPVGGYVTISGTGFGIANSVTFNGVGASFGINSDSQIYAWVPGGATTGPITVFNPAGSGSSALNFFVGDVPYISTFTPSGGPVGTEITLSGGGFDGVTDATLDGVSTSFTVDNLNQMRVTVPDGAVSGYLSVTNPSGTGTSSSSFFVGSLPQITLISPPFGPVGAPVMITGSGFTGVSLVDFNGTSSPFTIVSDGEITTSIPAGATSGFLRIVNPAGADTSDAVFGIAPAVTTFDPSCVASLHRDTTQVVILGTNFLGTTSVRMNDVEAAFTVDSDQRVRSSIPAGDVDGPISVTTPYGTAVSTASFRIIQLVPPPRVPGQDWPHDYTQNVAASTSASDHQNLVSVPDGVGGVFEVWTDNRSGNWDIYAQRITVYGAIAPGWPADGLPVCAHPAHQTEPSAVADGAGGVLIAWRDYRNDNGDIYAQHVLNDGTIEVTWPTEGLAVCVASNDQTLPAITADRSCGAYIAWQDIRNGGNWDIYAQHVTALGAVGQGWNPQGNLMCTNGSSQTGPSIASDGLGGALIAWTDHRCGPGTFLQRVLASGALAPGWPTDGVWATSGYCSSQYSPQVAPDGGGGAYVVWRDDRCYSNVFAQHLSPTGAIMPGWSSSGVSISDYCRYGITEEMRVIADEVGGALFCWNERSGYGQSDIMIKRVLTNAQVAPGWPQVGLRLMNDSPDQINPEMIPDGYGGVIVTWRDVRLGSWDTYAQRIMANGTAHPAWTLGGMRVSTAPGDQIEPTIVPGPDGSAIVSWRDSRYGNYRPFAQRIDGSGRLGNPAPAITQARDVPDDQGGKVRIQWSASYLDTLPTMEVGNYGIWRQVSEQAASAAFKAGARRVQSDVTASDARPGTYRVIASAQGASYWEGMASIPARGQATYSYVAQTLADSTAAGIAMGLYMVDAHADFFPYFWTSWSDSGYSVDNLPPSTPQGFAALQSPNGIWMHWEAGSERDLAGYRVYRGDAPDFVPDQASFLAAVTDTAYLDGTGSAAAHYKVVAVDIHENRSGVASTSVVGSVSTFPGMVPKELSFAPIAPNPARDRCTFRIGTPASQSMRLKVFDASGRMVRMLFDAIMEPGETTIIWDGRDEKGNQTASGVYLARLEAGGQVLRRRLVVVR